MVKSCIICGSSVAASGQSEIVACESDYCINVIENSIGLHYETGKPSLFGIHPAKPGLDKSSISIISVDNGITYIQTITT